MTDTQPRKPAEEVDAALSPKHGKFVETYFANGMNATAAAHVCGYKNPDEGTRLRVRPDVGTYIQAHLTEACMHDDEVLARLSNYVRVTGDYFATYKVPVFEPRPLSLKFTPLERQIAQFRGLNLERFKDRSDAAGQRADAADPSAWADCLARGERSSRGPGRTTTTRINSCPGWLSAPRLSRLLFADPLPTPC